VHPFLPVVYLFLGFFSTQGSEFVKVLKGLFWFIRTVNCVYKINMTEQDKQEKNHVKFCDMDVAGTKHTRFGLLYKLLHQNEIVIFFMDEKNNVDDIRFWV